MNITRNSLFQAAWDGDCKLMKEVVRKKDIDVNMADEDGDTPLVIATINGYIKIVKFLLKRDDILVNKTNKKGKYILVENIFTQDN